MFRRSSSSDAEKFLVEHDLENLELADLIMLRNELVMDLDPRVHKNRETLHREISNAVPSNQKHRITGIEAAKINRDIVQRNTFLELVKEYITIRVAEQQKELEKRRAVIELLKILPEDGSISLKTFSLITRYSEKEIENVLYKELDKDYPGSLSISDGEKVFQKGIGVDEYLKIVLNQILSFGKKLDEIVR